MTVIERWTLRLAPFSRPDGVDYTLIVADGPELRRGERPEVVRDTDYEGAVARADEATKLLEQSLAFIDGPIGSDANNTRARIGGFLLRGR